MNKKPVFWRTVIAVVIILLFGISMHPLAEKDFMETFKGMVKSDKQAELAPLYEKVEEIKVAEPGLYDSQVLEKAATAKGVDLKEYISAGKNIEDNRDVVSEVRKNASSSIRLGLDLAGGVEYIVELQRDGELAEGTDFEVYRDRAIEILRKRLEANKIYEVEITPTADKFITVKAPITSKSEKKQLLDLIQINANLRFRLVHKDNAVLVQQYLADKANFKTPIGYELMEVTTFRKGDEPIVETYFVETRAQMDGKGVIEAYPTRDQFGQRMIALRFNADGAEKFAKVTSKHVGRQLAIVLDGKLYCAPNIKDAITGGQATISGQFSQEELTNISNALSSGGFPFIIKVNSVSDTDPKLGAESVRNGIYAGIGALLIVVVFMMIYYRLSGVIACLALGVNVILVLGALAAFEATLTLPGMAGIILTIGMAIDANVLVFERIREELQVGKGLASAIDFGYSKAYSSVLDANITTLFVAVILMNIGTGPIKGFAVTLTIGIITSLFTALFLTRLVFDYLTRFTNIKTLTMMQCFKKPKFNFLGYSKIFAVISLAAIVVSFAIFAIKGKDTLSVDFTGGTLVNFNYTQRVNPQAVEKALKDQKINAQVSYKTGSNNDHKLEVLVQSGDSSVSMETIENTLNKAYPELKLTNGNEFRVGGLIGMEFSKTAILAIILSFIGIIIYVSFRYEFAYGMAGVLALVHDVIITSGIFICLGREFSLTVMAALLTIIGYSINDTVVIFDRIREGVALHPNDSYKDVVNLSINETLSRTLITSITTLFVVVILCLFGGVAINDFVLVMLIGILVGTYSSICIASPIVAVWHKKIGNK